MPLTLVNMIVRYLVVCRVMHVLRASDGSAQSSDSAELPMTPLFTEQSVDRKVISTDRKVISTDAGLAR